MSKFRSLISMEIIIVYIFFSIKENALRLKTGVDSYDNPIKTKKQKNPIKPKKKQ